MIVTQETKLCSIADCTTPLHGRGWCRRHYMYWYRYGDPCRQKRGKQHGLSGTPEHRSWLGMIQRCYDKNCGSYSNYGARGIKVCDRWRHSFTTFYEDLGTRPEGKSLDRIDNDGDYEQSNCRWATWSEQAANKRTPKTNTSGVKGVYKSRHKWGVSIGRNGQRFFLGYFDRIEDAIQAEKTY